jgi:hypothetical protein
MDPAMTSHSPTRYLVAAVLLLSLLAAPRGAWGAVKLCMKDGSYQMVSSYEVHGERVRYYSIERSAWEEVPTALVDFAATKRVEEEAKAAAKKQLEEAKEVDRERFYKPPNEGMEAAPGIRLPGDDGIFTVDGQRLVRLVQSTGEMVTDRKRAAMMSAMPLPLMKARSLVVLPGAKSIIRLNNPSPVFYVQSADGLGTRLELLRLKTGKDARVVQGVETSRGKNGKATEERTEVPVDRKQVAPNIYTLKPLQPLDAAEYVLGELVAEKLNLEVWDFGYDKWEVAK